MLFLKRVVHHRQIGNACTTKRLVHLLSQFDGQDLEKIAIRDNRNQFTYGEVQRNSVKVQKALSDLLKEQGQGNRNITFLTPNDARYVFTKFGIWLGGNVAVPLSPSHPPNMLEYFIRDTESAAVLCTKEHVDKLLPLCKSLGKVLIDIDSILEGQDDPAALFEPSDAENAMILYTSGTTGKPKGVVISHANLISQVGCLVDSWEWSSKDQILHTLPLHHTHGIVNALLCPLAKGASITMHPKFDASLVWDHLLSPSESSRTSVYMAVPTIYAKLLESFEKRWGLDPSKRDFARAMCQENVRLMVSGSAPLPVPVYDQWKDLTGHSLLERYGMTEIGMALSNPLDGERKRGFVGTPLPGVNVRIVKFTQMSPNGQYEVICTGNSKGTTIAAGRKSPYVGELLVKGPSVFKAYWNKPEETAKEFTNDRWFRTGDTAEYADGSYQILGRTSVDIIKSGGYKLSALSIETILLEHHSIVDCAVVGRPDITWGQKVAAVVVLKPGAKLTIKDVRSWASDKMASYMLPAELKVVSEIPRNTMGKVNKKELVMSYDSL